MEDNKHVKTFEQHQKNLNISDISDSLYCKICMGDMYNTFLTTNHNK